MIGLDSEPQVIAPLDRITYLGLNTLDCADSIHDFRNGYRGPGPDIKLKIQQKLVSMYSPEELHGSLSDIEFLNSLGIDTSTHPDIDFETGIFDSIPLGVGIASREDISLSELIEKTDRSISDSIVINNCNKTTITKLGPTQLDKVQTFIYNYLFDGVDSTEDVYFAFDASAANIGKIMSGRPHIFNLITPQTIADPATSQSKVDGMPLYYFPCDEGADNVFTAAQNTFSRSGGVEIKYRNNNFSETTPYGFQQSIVIDDKAIGTIDYAPVGNKRSGPSVNELINIMEGRASTRITIHDKAPFDAANQALLFDLKRLGDHEQVRGAINFKHEGAGHRVVFATKDKVCSVFAVMNGLATMVEGSNEIYLYRERPVTNKTTLTEEERASLQAAEQLKKKEAYNTIHRQFIKDIITNGVDFFTVPLKELEGYDTEPPDSVKKFEVRIKEIITAKMEENKIIISKIIESLYNIKQACEEESEKIRLAISNGDVETEYNIYYELNSKIETLISDPIVYSVYRKIIDKYSQVQELMYTIASAPEAGEVEEEVSKKRSESISKLYQLCFDFDMSRLYSAFEEMNTIYEDISVDSGPRAPRPISDWAVKYRDRIINTISTIGSTVISIFYADDNISGVRSLYTNIQSCIVNVVPAPLPPGQDRDAELQYYKGILLSFIERFGTQEKEEDCGEYAPQFGGYQRGGAYDDEDEEEGEITAISHIDSEGDYIPPRNMNANDIYYIKELCSIAEQYLTPLLVYNAPVLNGYSLLSTYIKAKKAYKQNITLIETLEKQIKDAGGSLEIDPAVLKAEFIDTLEGPKPPQYYIDHFDEETKADIVNVMGKIHKHWNMYIEEANIHKDNTKFLYNGFNEFFNQSMVPRLTEGIAAPDYTPVLISIFTLSILYHIINHSWNRSIYSAMGLIIEGRRNLDLLNTGNIDNVLLLLKNIDSNINIAEPKQMTFRNFIVATGGARRRTRGHRRTVNRRNRKTLRRY